MAKYGSFTYSNAKYGTGAPVILPASTAAVTWIVQIAWSGSYTGYNEGIWLQDASIFRGRRDYMGSGATSIQTMNPGSCTLTMQNIGGRFDPYAHNYIKPGRKMFVAVKDNSTGTTHRIFTGFVKDVRPLSGRNTVSIICSDNLELLKREKIRNFTPMYTTTISASIETVLSNVGWAHGSNIHSWAQPLSIFDPNSIAGIQYNSFSPSSKKPTIANNPTAYDVIEELAQASLGTIFCDKNGKIVYYPLSYNSMTTHTEDQAILLKEIITGAPWDNVRNSIKVTAKCKGKRPLGQIWASVGNQFVAGGSIINLPISWEPSIDIQYPYPGIDYHFMDSSGVDNSVFFHVTPVNITSTGCTLVIYAWAWQDGTMTWCQVNGRKLVDMPFSYYEEDTSSQTDFGIASFELESDYIQDRGYAAAFATIIKNGLKDPGKAPVIDIEARENIQFSFELMDKVHLDSAKLNINHTYKVGGIEYDWQNEPTGQACKTRLYLQEVLYSATSITADPFYPGVDPVPEIPYGPIIPTNPGNLDYCKGDYGAVSNGPYPLTFDKNIVSMGEIAKANFPCGLRPAQSIYPSHITIAGTFGGDALSNLRVFGFDGNGQPLIYAIPTPGTQYGFDFKPGSSVSVVGIGVSVETGGSSGYVKGVQQQYGSASANSTGIKITGLTIGEWYALEAYAGPWQVWDASPGTWRDIYNFGASPDGITWSGNMGLGYEETNYIYRYDVPTFGVAAEAVVGTYYGIFYFQAALTSVWFRPHIDTGPNGQNQGSLGWVLSLASSARNIQSLSANLYNICAP